MNRYILTEEIKKKYYTIVLKHMADIITCNIEDKSRYDVALDLSNTELNPYTLGELLKDVFGYEDNNMDTNGWEMDFWIHYRHPDDSYPPLCITGTGITFELFLRGEDNDYESLEERNEKLKNDKKFQELLQKGIELCLKSEKNT